VCCLCADCEEEPQPRAPGVELESLLKRLEKVTTRLEQTVGVASQSLFRQPASQTSVPEPLPLPPSQPPPAPPSQRTEEATHKMSVAAFGDIIRGPLSQYLQLSAKLGGDVATHSKLVEKAFR
jgi:adenylyl cyclase-associated protein